MYGRRDERLLDAVASGLFWYAFGLNNDWAPMKVARSVFLRWISGINPALASSASRRSVIAISVGHLRSTPPSSVGNVCEGRFSTSPPDCTPRMRAHQPYSLNARLMLAPIA